MSKGPRFLILATFLYTCIEGLVINIRYPDLLPFLYKDFAILLIYVLTLLPNLNRIVNPSRSLGGLGFGLWMFVGVTALYVALPGRPMVTELLAVKQRIFYIPLLFVGYQFVRTEQDVRRLFAVMALSAIGVSLFGVYLYFTGPSGLTSLGARFSAEIMTPSSTGVQYWRTPGTFTSPGQYGAYLMFNGMVALALILMPKVTRFWRLLGIVSLTLVVFATFVSGSRTPAVILGVSAALMVLSGRRLHRAFGLSLAAYVIAALGFVLLGPGTRDRFASIVSYEHVERFQTTYFGQLFLPDLAAEPFGQGLGAATVGARHLTQSGELERLVESYLGILAVETGVLGLIVFLILAVTLFANIGGRYRLMARSPDGVAWLTFAIYALLNLLLTPVSTGIDHAPTNFYFWFAIGAAAKLVDLYVVRRGAVVAASVPVPQWPVRVGPVAPVRPLPQVQRTHFTTRSGRL